MKYPKSKSGSLENSILSVWSEAAKKEGNAFGQAVMSAKEKGDKSFMFAGKKYDVEESCLILEGEVYVTAGSESVEIKSGDFVIFPKGLACVWQVTKPIRKHYQFGG